MDPREALLTLVNLPGLGPIKIRLLIEYFGSAENALRGTEESFRQLPGFGPHIINTLLNWEKSPYWRRDLQLVEERGIDLIPFNDPRYPQALHALPAPPALLYVQGSMDLNSSPAIGIVGTRQATIYGRDAARRFAETIANAGYTVVSGLARGIDTEAHQGALAAGQTIAVIGSGLANCYPKENLQLAEEMSKNGAVISEYPMCTPPDRTHFPQRNRIVAALSKGMLLIEAPKKSGAMITMEIAHSLEKDLFALPGRTDWTSFEGNHTLIKTGQADLVDTPNDLLSRYETFFQTSTQKKGFKIPPLEEEEKTLYNLIPLEEKSVEEIAALSQLPMSKLNILLMSLVIKKAIKEYPGRIYKKVY